ncbi:MAG: S41 family peptidase [Aridibacter famidurans]|nr:S41 family peptidase [Aridibacter famidurans]
MRSIDLKVLKLAHAGILPSRSRTAIHIQVLILLAMMVFLSTEASAQGIMSGMPTKGEAEVVKISDDQKRAVIEKLKESILEGYILRDKAKGAADRIGEKFSSGAYKETGDAYAFGRALTMDLRAITNDPHFNVLYHPLLFQRLEQMASAAAANGAGSGGGQGGSSAQPPPSTDSKKNFFFRKLEVLEGNVGYLKLELIPQINEAKPTLDSAMGFLGNTDAMIIDLRDNPGGFGGFISYFMSYFFPAEKMLLFKRELSIADSQEFYVETDLPNKRLDKIPVYILINQRTGSAATNFSYTMQKHGRATVVGQTTGAGSLGAHSASPFTLAGGFVATIPIGRVVHPKTNSNWNMTGVVPDIPTEGDALEAAHDAALEKLGVKKPS